jgi:hypothetical protein
MSAKKSSKAKTPAPPNKRTRFPATEAALAGRPLTEAAAQPTTVDAAPVDDAAGMTTPEPGQTEAAPEITGLEGSAESAPDLCPATAGDATPTEVALPEPAAVEGAAASVEATTEHLAVEGEGTEATAEGTTPDAAPPQSVGVTPDAAATGTETATQTGKGKKGRKPRASKVKAGEGDAATKKLSALDAAAKVLGEAGQPMGCKEMIAAMAAKGYWSSPAGRTPEATLYSAILRELTTKGDQARFVKAQRGQFALR